MRKQTIDTHTSTVEKAISVKWLSWNRSRVILAEPGLKFMLKSDDTKNLKIVIK
jgi:hypothetical protein